VKLTSLHIIHINSCRSQNPEMGFTVKMYIVRHNKTESVSVPANDNYRACDVSVAAKQWREPSVLIVMSACPSVRSHVTACVHWTGFREISYCAFLLKLVEQIQVR
jgi:hypothetical protein